MIIQPSILSKLGKTVLLILIIFAPILNSFSYNETNIEVDKIIKNINMKNEFIKTANISGKVNYILPKNKKIKLYKKYKIKRDSKIHINIYIFLRFKVAEFISDGNQVWYKRIKKKEKRKDIMDFNLNIFNKHLDLNLTVNELNNMLLGLSIAKFEDGSYKYEIKQNYLYIFQKKIISKIDLNTKRIIEITINDKRKAKILYSDFKAVKINENIKFSQEILIPRKISLTTPTFSMKIKHQNAIIINNKIKDKKFSINQ